MHDKRMAEILGGLAMAAGAAIMEIYERNDHDVETKDDRSPVTAADLAADRVICSGLAEAYPDIQVVTEERADTHVLGADRPHFLVDPLDGTKEFIRRRGEFTVNIALIEGGRPVAGIVYAPAIGRLFATAPGGGAVERSVHEGQASADSTIRAAQADMTALRVVASKSHRDADTDAYIARYTVSNLVSAGSSLKFCLVASGEADLYPRFGPTMEWDTAAGQAVLEAAGGRVLGLPNLAPMTYGHPGRRNGRFLAIGRDVELVDLV